MNTKKLLTQLAIVAAVLVGGCTKNSDTTTPVPVILGAQTTVQSSVALGQAANFAILAGSTVTNTGSTTILGNLGLSAGSSVVGFPPGILTGTQHVKDDIAIQAKLDLTAAYVDAAGRSASDRATISGDQGGKTLTPGLYMSTSSLAISSGDLTLDGKGDANAVFIFQIGSSLTTTSGHNVVLVGGAQSKNIFWQVGSSATIGTGCAFKGTIMAYASITLTTGATLDGRALAQVGAVTMDANTITIAGANVFGIQSTVQLPVSLGGAYNFALLAGTTITNTGGTVIAGDLGLSPGSSVTGFPPATLNGVSHVDDPSSVQAKLDLTAAYTNVAARTSSDRVLLDGNIGGLTLTPGLYNATSSLEISSGDLILDAKGNSNAIFIFQITSTLVTTSGRQVILTNGAKQDNIFWQVGSSATLGTNSVMKGTIMAYASITITTGAQLDGRALAQTGAVTLDNNAITCLRLFGAQNTAQATVALGSAYNFAILAGTTITNTGGTVVTGNFGLNPGTSVTGFPPGSVNGVQYISENVSNQAKVDFSTAYNDAANRSSADVVVLSGNIGGLTLYPGLYRAPSSLAISSGDLTLDAKGNANAVFIFQIGSTLVTTSGRQVILQNGAQASNIFWEVGSSATLGTNSYLAGTIMAQTSITLTTGAQLDGRAFAMDGAVTMDNNAVTCQRVFGIQATVLSTLSLGGAAGFAVLAGSTITNTGSTTINGDLGLSPGTSVVGFPPGILTGTQHVNDATVNQAKLDITAAFNDLAGRTSPEVVAIAGNIGGLTLYPGLYNSASSIAVSSGDLILDGQGNANAIFVFQAGSTLVTTTGRKVILQNGAQASNVFWQVGSSATLGTNSTFVGTIIAKASITLTSGATLNGRAFAQVAAVTMDNNTIVKK